jgi:hypothetical protein
VQCGRSGPVTFARRLEDPLPQPPYDRLLGPPIDAVPIEAFALRSVHCRQHRRVRDGETVSGHRVQLALRFPQPVVAGFKGSPASRQPLSGPGTRPGIRPVIRNHRRRSRHAALRFPVAFRPPAFASWGILSRRPLRSAYRATERRHGPERGLHVPHARDPAGSPRVSWPHGWRRAKRGITEVRRCARPAAQNTEVPAVQTAAVGTDSFTLCASGLGFLGGIMTRCTMPTPNG